MHSAPEEYSGNQSKPVTALKACCANGGPKLINNREWRNFLRIICLDSTQSGNLKPGKTTVRGYNYLFYLGPFVPSSSRYSHAFLPQPPPYSFHNRSCLRPTRLLENLRARTRAGEHNTSCTGNPEQNREHPSGGTENGCPPLC